MQAGCVGSFVRSVDGQWTFPARVGNLIFSLAFDGRAPFV